MTSAPLLIDRLLAPGGVRAVLQPVYDARSEAACGVECLSRGPVGSSGESAAVLFDYVRRKHREADVDRACIAAALEAASALHGGTRVGVNIHAVTLARDGGFPAWMLDLCEKTRIAPSRLVLEIVEHGPAQDLEALAAALVTLRCEGVHLALDDMGIGNSGLRMVVEWAPEFIKIDRFFIAGMQTDHRCRAVVDSVVSLARSVGALTVGEGVETLEQLALVAAAGVHLVQGYALCEPLPLSALAVRVPTLFTRPAQRGPEET